MRCRLLIRWFVRLHILLAILLTIPPADAIAADDALLTVKRGLTGRLAFSHPSGTLQAMPNQKMDAEVLVRVERVDPLNRDRQPDQPHDYTLWFFGTVAGDYDLSRLVVKHDGSPLTDADALPTMPVKVVSDLPPDRGTSLYEIDDPILRAPRGYRAILLTFALLWACVPVVWVLSRWWSRRPESPSIVQYKPTLSDRLRPLIQQASRGELTVQQQGQLELLLYAYWRQRLGLSDSVVGALPVLRRHHEAGHLLRTLEGWLHADESARIDLDADAIESLLAPYQESEALGGAV
ncbi:hypothetical protein Q31b_08870 [Novipirellula aureliae]|uniref:MxaA protein n=1 Tax=Novipirellula aureliae TaxID=2527966 RepID=A0A5C6EDD2_9BACT|nr:hypothetical protein [Novipirellula aureliae]TWU45711.1 hypothetical protein Q31b_08870 [Novipirellula aureliae]